MPPDRVVFTEDLDRLTPSDLEGVRFIHQGDPENWTEEHRLRLKEVVDQRGLYHPLDAAALEQKLGNVLSTPYTRRSLSRSTSPTSTLDGRTPSPDPEWEAIKAENRRKNEKYYRDLIERGGRPASSLAVFYASGDCGEYEDILNYWGSKGGLLGQLWAWVDFQRFQRRNRRTVELFAQYLQDVREYRRDEGIEGNVNLLFDPKQQTKVDEWKEYHYFQHRKLAEMRTKAEDGRRERELRKEKWEEGSATENYTVPMVPPEMGWIYQVKTIPESELDQFMILLNWIEQQLPEIARECVISNEEAPGNAPNPLGLVEASGTASIPEKVISTGFSSQKHMKSNPRSTNKKRKPTSPILRAVDAPRVTKPSRKTKSSVPNQCHDVLVSGTSPTPLRRADARRVTRAKTRAAKALMNPPTLSLAKSPSEPVPPRRSQRIQDLKNRRNEQTEIMQVAARQATSRVKSQRKPKERVSKVQNISPRARPQGIAKSVVARKRNCSRVAK